MSLQSETGFRDFPVYYRYWGKASLSDGAGEPYHLLPYHSLDVAATGFIFLKKQPYTAVKLAGLLGMPVGDFIKWMQWFLAIHDLGKFSESFQHLRPDLLQWLQGRDSDKQYTERHDTLGYQLWLNSVHAGMQNEGWFDKEESSVWGAGSLDNPENHWVMAVTGHHGLPPKLEQSVTRIKDCFIEEDKIAALQFAIDTARFFLLEPQPQTLPAVENVRKVSWWLAGLSVMCDWIGSNKDYFAYQSEPLDIEVYWQQACGRAEKALAAAGVMGSATAVRMSLQELFYPNLQQPTPLQKFCSDVNLAKGGQLFILEDVTGAGKTEAAVMLAHRILAAGYARGLYFALPTMATSDAMYRRLEKVYQRLYSDDSNPSLVLAHGARDLSKTFRQSTIPVTSSVESEYGDATSPAGVYCNAWIADNRKKALLAEIGVGTIDQALLGILPSRHQSLRLLGLLDKILIVDEVHACDAYMHKLLCALVQAQARVGGSIILLSATLPAHQREELIQSFQQGAGWREDKATALSNGYPMVTQTHANNVGQTQLPTRDSVRREVKVEWVDVPDKVLELITQASAAGKCVCWIRNTVADAREAYRQLVGSHPDREVILFHARFAMADRLGVEERVVNSFGPKSTAEQRRGKILIATQVVEQSLDLDFDVMISDLAPVDLIIQRAGRLCRHRRDVEGNLIDRKDQRGIPTLVVHGPLPEKDIREDWFSRDFPGAAKVYENHAQLWLTAKLLQERGGFRMPEDARLLIEGVYGDKSDQQVPESLWENRRRAEGGAMGERSIAMMNLLKLDSGYNGSGENRWWEEDVTPTRLGEPTIQVYLARWDGKSLKPWANDQLFPWAQSAVSVRKVQIAESVLPDGLTPEELESCREQFPGKGRWGVLLPLQRGEDGRWKGEVRDEKGKIRQVEYDVAYGFWLG